ncbi:hypothetical protein ACOSP7_020233 [Xanthoceras sorbifolium]
MRLESMWYAKVQQHPSTQDLLAILSFNRGDHAWAAISKGSNIVAKVKGETILKSFGEYDHWKSNVNQKGLIPTLNDHIRLIFYAPGTDPEEEKSWIVCTDRLNVCLENRPQYV